MTIKYSLALTGLPVAALTGTTVFSAPAMAGGIDLTINIPRLSVAEYHRPYVAIWIEQKDKPNLRNLAIWFDHDMKANEGTKWLRDVRTW